MAAIVLAIVAMAGGATLLLNARRNSMIAMRTRVLMLGNDVTVRTLIDEPLGIIAESVDKDGKVEGLGYAMLGSGGRIGRGNGAPKGTTLRLRLALNADIISVDTTGTRALLVRREMRGITGGSSSGLMFLFEGALNERSVDHRGGALQLWIDLVDGKLMIREGEE